MIHDQEPNWKLIYNCGKSLRHVIDLKGGYPSHQWYTNRESQVVYDLELLILSKSLLLFGLCYGPQDHKFAWEYQLGQTTYHMWETYKALFHGRK